MHIELFFWHNKIGKKNGKKIIMAKKIGKSMARYLCINTLIKKNNIPVPWDQLETDAGSCCSTGNE